MILKHLFTLMMLILVHANCAADNFEKEAGDINWTGFYAGVSLGAIFNKSLVDAQHINFINGSTYRENLNETDVLPGLHAGYNHQLQSGLVVGGEADFTYPDSTEHFIRVGIPNGEFDELTVKNRLQGSIRSKLGYALNNFLPYVTAGVSFADTSLRYNNERRDKYEKDSVQTGWVLGGGLEYAFCNKLSVRTEYLYTDYGDPISLQIPTILVNDPNGSASADLVSHSVRVALNYRF
jgi:outer membrane immunogenic protein